MTRRTPVIFTTALVAIGLALSGCADKTAESAPDASASSLAGYPVTVGDTTLDKRPERIVVLSPTATEMIFAIGAGPQVTAVDDNSNYPTQAPKSGLSGFQPNVEAIAAKNPDLVVLSNDTNKVVDQLTTLHIPVYLSPAASTLEDTFAQLTDLGKLTGHIDESADLVRRMKDDIAKLIGDLPQRTKPLTYYYELDSTLYSVTSKTFIGSLFALVGMKSIADPSDANGAKGGYPQLSAEVIVKANPDLIFLADSKCCQQSAETISARPGWGNLDAIRNNRVIMLDDDVASRWGPRVVDLVRAIVDAVHKTP